MKYFFLIKVVTISVMLFYFQISTAQTISLDTVFFNGCIKNLMKFSDFINTGIKIDSIIKPGDPEGYSDPPDSIIHVGSSSFYLYTRNGVCSAHSIWFDKIKSVRIGQYLFSDSTTFNDLKRMFPTNCASLKTIKHNTFKSIALKTCNVNVTDSKGQLWDMSINFFLTDDKLVGLDFWQPD